MESDTLYRCLCEVSWKEEKKALMKVLVKTNTELFLQAWEWFITMAETLLIPLDDTTQLPSLLMRGSMYTCLSTPSPCVGIECSNPIYKQLFYYSNHSVVRFGSLIVKAHTRQLPLHSEYYTRATSARYRIQVRLLFLHCFITDLVN